MLSSERSAPTVFNESNDSFISQMKSQSQLKVKDLIKGQTLISIEPNRPLDRALMIMVNQQKRHIPVVTKHTEELKGIITEQDMRMVLSSPNLDHVNVEHALQQLNQRTVDSAMSKSVFTVDEDDLVVEAVKIMRLSKVSGLPVLNKSGKVVGIITQQDCMDQLIRLLDPIQIEQDDLKAFQERLSQ